jgi:hypothetical protein
MTSLKQELSSSIRREREEATKKLSEIIEQSEALPEEIVRSLFGGLSVEEGVGSNFLISVVDAIRLAVKVPRGFDVNSLVRDLLKSTEDPLLVTAVSALISAKAQLQLEDLEDQIIDRLQKAIEETKDLPDAGASVQVTGEANLRNSGISLTEALFSLSISLQIPKNPSILAKLVSLGAKHNNRFVREKSLDLLLVMLSRDTDPVFVANVINQGLKDVWSQVKFAAVKVMRKFVEMAGDQFSDEIKKIVIPQILLNRHFPGEGLKLICHETWKLYVEKSKGMQGMEIVMDNIPEIFRLIESVLVGEQSCCEGHEHGQEGAGGGDHGIGEAAMFLLYEMHHKVLSRDDSESVYTDSIGQISMEILISGISDPSWPVKSVACQVTKQVSESVKNKYPEIFGKFWEALKLSLMKSVTSMIPGLRKEAATALAAAAVIHGGSENLREENCETIKETWAKLKLDDFVEPHSNKPMFSCCSFTSSGANAVGSNADRLDGFIWLAKFLGVKEAEKSVIAEIRETTSNGILVKTARCALE